MKQTFKETDILYMSGCKNRRLKLKIHVKSGDATFKQTVET